MDSDDLYCDEDFEDFFKNENIEDNQDHQEHHQDQQPLFDIEQEEKFVGINIQKEMNFNFWNLSNNNNLKPFIKVTRMDAISWIFNCREEYSFRFRLQTVYLSIAYFDRFVFEMIRVKKEEMVPFGLVTVACLSLAAKMEDRDNSPLLTFYGSGFESKEIAKIEGLVSVTLQWRMSLITPFHFLNYFILRFSSENHNAITYQILSATEGFILLLIKEINYMCYRPSVVAAAATLMALDQSLTRQALEARLNPISFLQTESVIECYNIIKRLKTQQESATRLRSSIGTNWKITLQF